jgi:hypothetical protein
MNTKQVVSHLGVLTLMSLGCQQVRATQIVIVNSGSGGDSSYGNSYDSASGYSALGNGTYTMSSTGTAAGLTANQLFGSATDPAGNFGRPASADSNVSVNLATGEIKIFEEMGPCYSIGIPGCGGTVNAGGGIREGVTFHNTTGLAETVGFTWRASLDATVQVVPLPNGSALYSGVGGTTVFAILGGEVTYDFGSCGVSNCGAIDGSRTGGFDTLTMTPSGTFGAQFFATATLAPGDTFTPVFENFNPVCVLGATCDGTHTGALTMSLPTGVTFTSDSGIFLTQTPATSGTPEPGTWVLMGCGIVGLGMVRARKRQA